jgi:Ca2+-binding RTX toxin-like protein
MAYFRSLDQIDMREIDFRQEFLDANTYRFRNDVGYDDPPLDEFYPDALVLRYDDALNSSKFYYGSGITVTNGEVTSGTLGASVSYFVENGQRFYSEVLLDANFSAVALYDAQQTASRADDRALLAQIYRGSDRILLSRFDDFFEGMRGNDRLQGARGDDTLAGNNGDDSLAGGRSGADRLIGGAGDDRLSGGANVGQDIFVFRDLGDSDTITDFVDGRDRIELQNTGSGQVTVQQVGDDVRIRFGVSEIMVLNERASDFSNADFIFS